MFSRTNREFLIFLFFFAIAGVFWLMMTLNETFEKELRIPVCYTNIDKNTVLTSPETDTIRVTVSDKGYMIAAYLTGDLRSPIKIDFNDYAHDGRGTVSSADLMKMVNGRLKASTKVISIKPEKLVFYYNKGERKKVPVVWKGTVTPEDLHYISDVAYSPESVYVYAPSEKLDNITRVYTEPLNFTEVRDTLNVDCPLQKMAGVKMVPDHVGLRFMTDILIEESIDGIPVQGINMPEGETLRTFPAKVRVHFVTGMKRFQTLRAQDFVVIADYQELDPSTSSKCRIILQQVPEGITRARLDTMWVDYLIEEE